MKFSESSLHKNAVKEINVRKFFSAILQKGLQMLITVFQIKWKTFKNISSELSDV